MKKILSAILCIAVLFSLSLTVHAAGSSASLNGNSAVTVGSNIVLTVKVSGCANATSVSAAVSFGSNFEYVSASWLKNGMINNPYDTGTGKGALGGLSSPDINGDLYQITLKAKTVSASNQTVSVTIVAKNGGSEIMNSVASKQIKINCATHSYGAYTKVNDSQHKRTCSACGNVETAGHNWNSGSVTQNANCKDPGNKKYTCTSCSAEKNEVINKTNNHNFSSWSQTKAPGCTSSGTESRTCSVCNKTETRNVNPTGHSFTNPVVTKEPTCTEPGTESGSCTRCGEKTTNQIKAKGHSFGNWEEIRAAGCEEKGEEKRTCSVCKESESREIAVLGHDFEKETVVKEPTISSTGLSEGKCKRCNKVTSQVLPCRAEDKATGILFEAEEGVFAEGTEVSVEKVAEGNDEFNAVKESLAQISTTFEVYCISALQNGADVKPNGKVSATFTVPKGFGKNIAVYRIGDNGVAEKVESVVSEDGTTVQVEVSDLGSFAIVDLAGAGQNNSDKNTDTTPGTNTEAPEKGNVLVVGVVVAVAGVVFAVAAVGIIVIILKRKKQ